MAPKQKTSTGATTMMKCSIGILTSILLELASHNASAQEQHFDFSSTTGMQTTCQRFSMKSAQPTSDDDKIATVVCDGVQLVTQVATWAHTRLAKVSLNDKQEGNTLVKDIKAELSFVLQRLQTARTRLQTVRLAQSTFAIEPGNWEIDLDGDGSITNFERYFFWIPQQDAPRATWSGTRTADYYNAHFVKPVIKIDQSDLLWAIAYCHFAEAALHLLLSYDFDQQTFGLIVADKKRIRTEAYSHALAGLDYSQRLRQSLLQEHDDEMEWIPNSAQRNTVFPLPIDEQTFTTWGIILDYLVELFRGKALLGGEVRDAQAGVGRMFGEDVCPPNQGINIKTLFTQPFEHLASLEELKQRCQSPTKALPLSGLYKTLSEVVARNSDRRQEGMSGEWMVLRHLYWVN
jgi:hypothetical protein